MNSIEISGKTVDEAIKLGLRELGMDPADVTIDVIDSGSPGLFGMFGKLAKVRLSVRQADPEYEFDVASLMGADDKPAKRQSAAKAPQSDGGKAQGKAKPRDAGEAREAARPKAPAAPKAAPPSARQTRERAASAPTERARARERSEYVMESAELFPPTDAASLTESGTIAYEFLSEATRLMGFDVEVRIREGEGHVSCQLVGETRGILVGRRGETLDALQYLASLKVNRRREDYVRVLLDAEQFRLKREDALFKLAQRMASRAVDTGSGVALEPMNPHERRIIHSALQDDPNVETHSEGEEPYRRVVIAPRR